MQSTTRFGALAFGDARNYVIYTNKSAPHAVPTFLNLAHNVLLKHHAGSANVRIDAALTGMLSFESAAFRPQNIASCA